MINKTNTNPYEGIDVRGKIMVVAGMPPELAAARPVVPEQAPEAAGAGGERVPTRLGSRTPTS